MLTTTRPDQAPQPQHSPWQERYGQVGEKEGSTCVNRFRIRKFRMIETSNEFKVEDPSDKQIVSS